MDTLHRIWLRALVIALISIAATMRSDAQSLPFVAPDIVLPPVVEEPDPFADYLGVRVSIDGRFAVTRAQHVVYVYRRERQAGWQFDARLAMDDPSEYVTDLILRNETLLVGTPMALHVYRRGRSHTWLRVQTLIPPVAPADHAAAIDFDGNVAVVGSPSNDESGGRVYVYRQRHRFFELEQIITVPDNDTPFGPYFGVDVALDRGDLLIGAPGADLGIGAVYVYRREAGQWTVQQRLVGSQSNSSTEPQFGYSLSMSGRVAVIGVPYADRIETPSGFRFRGAAYIFERIRNRWVEKQRLANPTEDGVFFSSSLITDGKRVVIYVSGIGDPTQQHADTYGYFYERINGSWEATNILISAQRPAPQWGLDFDISGNVLISGDADAVTEGSPLHGQIQLYRLCEIAVRQAGCRRRDE